jgi:transmembrane sensor
MSDPRPDSDDEIDPVELAAAEWFVRRDRGFAAGERAEFERWLRASARHRAAYARLDTTWTILERVPPHAVPESAPARRGARRTAIFWPAVSFAAAAGVALAFLYLRPAPSATAPLSRSVATAVGGLERIELPDGSRVIVNTGSAVAIRYTAGERAVELMAGEAAFEVAHDAARPFIVRSQDVGVRAVGTAFMVRRRADAIEVLVTEGRVRLGEVASGRDLLAPAPGAPAAPSEAAVLGAHQRAVISLAPRALAVPVVARVDAAEVARARAWQERRLEFSDERLDRIVAEFNRYNRHQLVLADPALGAQLFGGKFPTDAPAALVRMLEINFGVVAERGAEATVLRLAPVGPPGR